MAQGATSAADGPIRCERRGDILLVAIDRPHKRNALDDRAIESLHATFLALDPAVRAVVLHGEGPHFSAGLDLSEVAERDVTAGVWHSRMWHRAFEAIEFGRTPVVSVLKGAVIGGGLELAAATHVRVAEASAYYALPEGQRGIFVGGGGSVRLPRLIGVSRMMEMMLTGRVYGAQEGLALGLSHYVTPEGEGLAKALELAQRIAGNTDLTNFALVHALPRIAEADPATGYLTEALMAAIAQGDDAAKQRLKDFLEKRAAKVVAAGSPGGTP
ncbi:MAG TPA: crotonase/enoyl-CoA hydratase family protein [Beijerinckiaceae bacterium]|jgi:enoyl-CoA hydratase/carnithine racemase